MLNAVPILGWLLDLLFKASMAVPFWFFWTVCGLGEKYFGFLPAVYLAPPFWHCAGLFIVAGILLGFVPKVVSVSNDNSKA